METIQILRDVSKLVYEKIKGMPGTDDAAGDFGRGAGGDISRNIDITAENTVLNYLKEIKHFEQDPGSKVYISRFLHLCKYFVSNWTKITTDMPIFSDIDYVGDFENK